MEHSAGQHANDIGILIVEDDYLGVQQIRDVIEQTGFSVVGEARTGDDAVRLVLSLHPDIVLMDIRMTPTDGIETARRIQQLCPRPVILLSAYQNQHMFLNKNRPILPEYTDARVHSGRFQEHRRSQWGVHPAAGKYPDEIQNVPVRRVP